MANWDALLGLPLDSALQNARAMGLEPRVLVTRAPKRRGDDAPVDPQGTLRVIRVRERDGLELTVSAFQDGDPRQD